MPAKSVDNRLIDELVGRAQAEGLQLTGEGGLLQQLTKRLLESALGYLAHRHPALATPLMVAMGGAAVLAACIVPIAIR